MLSPYNETEKLIRCNVTNRYNEQSIRLIELSSFQLWEYLMTHKHGARISDVTLCLWLSSQEFEDHESIYSRAGEAEAVNRVVVDLFDEEYGFSNPVIRYVRASETEQIKKILTSHLPEAIRNSDNCGIYTHEGFSIIQHQHIDRGSFLTGFAKA
jgi:hypothetical protein